MGWDGMFAGGVAGCSGCVEVIQRGRVAMQLVTQWSNGVMEGSKGSETRLVLGWARLIMPVC